MSEFDHYLDDDFDAALFDAALSAANNAVSLPKPVPVAFRAAPANRLEGAAGSSQVKYKQQTLFGAKEVPEKPNRNSQQSLHRRPTASTLQNTQSGLSGQVAPRVKAIKHWDRIQSIKSLTRVISNGRPLKTAARKPIRDERDPDEGFLSDEPDSETERLLLAAQNAENAHAPIPMHLSCDPEEIKTWIYSINKPKRKYQYDIVAKALFNNCLVSLPTGLGKTFIAAVVMLNFYRWYPKGKILFLGPTKPLVQQQIEACHSIAGIPSRDCLTLTGSVSPAKRAKVWAQKRVVFSTPQTVMNDLAKGLLRPQDVICVVVDEAHRATGAYAYCVVIKWLMRFNPHFRVLALTATPGSEPERVQEVIDNLHIGHIEVRTEESMDIKPYTMEKDIVLEIVSLSTDLVSIRDKWAALMKPFIKQCDALFRGSKEPAHIHPFSITTALTILPQERGYMRPNLQCLAKMANVMAKLLEYSIPIAYEKMCEFKKEPTKAAKGLCSLMGYKSLLNDIQALICTPTFSPHPKMDKMKALIIEFFLNASEQSKSSRLMVFCHFRDVVTDIVDFLNAEQPLIKASAFIGQGTDSKGNRGMTQKQQAQVITKFKANDFNVLVATSIGEEGLDIGALDCIICYDAQKSPLRMLQRLGRTGRNEAGKVIVLMAQGREEQNWDKAKDQYQHVQNALLSKTVLELFEDCERLIPEGIRPMPVDKELPPEPYVAEEVELERVVSTVTTKRKKRPGVKDLPAGTLDGFVSARDFKPVTKSLADRAQAALLNESEMETLKKQWQRGAERAAPPIDVGNMKIRSFCTYSTNIPSAKFEGVLEGMTKLATDEEAYDRWKGAMAAAFNDQNVVWWSEDQQGKGACRPVKLCVGTRGEGVRRTWNKFAPPERHSQAFITGSPEIEIVGSADGPVPKSSGRSRDTYERPTIAHDVDDDDLPDELTIFTGLARPNPRLSNSHDLSERSPSIPESSPHACGMADFYLPPTCDPLSPSFHSATNASGVAVDSPSQVDARLINCDVKVEELRSELAKPQDGPSADAEHYSPGKERGGTPGGNASQDEYGMLSDWDPIQLEQLDEIEQAHTAVRSGPQPPETPLPMRAARSLNLDLEDEVSPLMVRSKRIHGEHSWRGEVGNADQVLMGPPSVRGTQMPRAQGFRIRESEGGDLKQRRRLKVMLSDETDQEVKAGSSRLPRESDADGFLVPALVATQMPRVAKRRRRQSGDLGGEVRRKLVIAEDTEEEDATDAREVQHRSVAAKGTSKRKSKKGKERAIEETGKSPSPMRQMKAGGTGEGNSKVGAKRGNDWAFKNNLFDLEASESENSASSDGREGKRRRAGRKKKARRSSSEPEIASEDSFDRAFLVDELSSRGHDESGEQSMTAFYRASIMSQNPLVAGKFQQKANNYNGCFKWPTPAGGPGKKKKSEDTPGTGEGDRSTDQWSYDSFCVPDEATLEYEEEAHEASDL